MGVGVVAWWGKRTEMNHSTPSIVQNKLLKRKKKKIVLRRELRTLSSAVCLAESLAAVSGRPLPVRPSGTHRRVR